MTGTGADRGRTWRARVRRAAPLVALGVAVVAVAIIVTPDRVTRLPLDPASTAPDGTRALVDVLRGVDRDVEIVTPEQAATADDAADGAAQVILLLYDQMDEEQRAALERRVEAGARLVVTDPASSLTPDVAAGVPLLERHLDRACRFDALRDSRRVRPGTALAYEVPEGAHGCYDVAVGGSWLVAEGSGHGQVIAIGGAAFLTNSMLAAADNAVLAVHLLAPGATSRTQIVQPVLRSAGGDRLADLIGDDVRAALWQVLIGFLVLVAWRARRLGAPLVDHAPVRLASSDLTAAVGALLARHDTRPASLARVAAATRRRLARRLGLPDAVDPEVLAERVAEHTARDTATVSRVLDPPPPTSDAALLRATSDLSDLEQSLVSEAQSSLEESDVR